MMLDGRRIDLPGSETQDAPPKVVAWRLLPSPKDELRIIELSIKPPKSPAFDAHLVLWEEGRFDLVSRINDADPRPRLWAEEGIRGLGFEERQKELQRWTLRDWWDGLQQKGLQPILAAAGNRVICDSEQAALIYEPEYQIYRLYQRGGGGLSGSSPVVFFSKGLLHHASLPFGAFDEKERITPDRLRTLFGAACPADLPSLVFSAIPLLRDGEALDFRQASALDLVRDQISLFFRFPVLELPHPLGSSGTIQIDLGLFEMSQDDPNAQNLRLQAITSQPLLLKASAGYLSDLIRRELWRMKERPAQTWAGYTPKQVAEAIRVALREDHYNMQGFLPKKPGDYRYDPETGDFRIVLRRKLSAHSLLLRGEALGRRYLGFFVPYIREGREGLDLLSEYGSFLRDPSFSQIAESLVWQDAWLTAPASESRAAWLSSAGLPFTPLLRQMPDWGRGFAHALFLLDRSGA